MLGWVTKEAAMHAGMTHHVRTYGVFPAYARDLYDYGAPVIAFKHPVFEWLDLYLATPIVTWIQTVRGEPPTFMIEIVGPLK